MDLRQRGVRDAHSQELSKLSIRSTNEKRSRSYNGFVVNGTTSIILILLFYGTLWSFIHFRLNSLPTPLEIKNSTNPTDFVEERVRNDLSKIVNLGPRVTGSIANKKGRDVILEMIEEIKDNALDIHDVSVDLQKVDGDFSVDFIVAHFTSVYKNINSIVVKFSRKEEPSNHSVLVNCHYDSVVDSPGASDDAVSCCVMLELLRSFSQHKETFKHNVIFLFNGAEENILQASHGFITKHPWGKTIKTFVNLEATGAGGWEMVFQTGPENPWLMRSYINSVKYPSASVFSQEIFQSGKIPGDTDFRIFRDFGNLAGLDIAHIRYGCVYHTSNDLPRYIQPGSIQRGGENLDSLLKALISSPQLVDPGPEKHGSIVFFDFIGYFMISYPMRMAFILNIGISSLVLLMIFRKINGFSDSGLRGMNYVKDLLYAVLFVIITWCIMMLTSICMALLVTILEKEMSWYTNTFNIIWLYILPPVISALMFHELLKETFYKTYNAWSVESLFYEANMMLWTCFLLVLTYHRIYSAYVMLLFVLFPLLIRSRIASAFNINFKERTNIYLLFHFGSILIPASYAKYATYLLTELVIAVLGRSGADIKPEIIISLIVAAPILLLTNYHSSLVYISCNIRKCIIVLAVLCIAGFMSVVFTNLGFPFSTSLQDGSMQRIYLTHFDRIDHKMNGELIVRDANVWHFQFDCHGAKLLQKHTNIFENSSLTQCDGVYCGLPFLLPVLHMGDVRKYLQVPAPRLQNYQRSEVKLFNKEMISQDTVRLTFHITGTDHITCFLSPRLGVTFKTWSLEDGNPLSIETLSMIEQPTYFIYYSHETPPDSPWQFSLTLHVGSSYDLNKAILDFSAVGHYLHGDKKVTPFLSQLIEKLPQWTVSQSETATVDVYEF